VREVKARKDTPVWRRDQDADQACALKLTAAGIKAIAVDDSHGVDEAAPQAPCGDSLPYEAARDAIHDATKAAGPVEPGCVAATPISPRMGTKIAEVIALLEGERGATLGQLAAATGWLPRTTRAALSGLRKRGYQVTLDRSDRPTVRPIGSCPRPRRAGRPKRPSPPSARSLEPPAHPLAAPTMSLLAACASPGRLARTMDEARPRNPCTPLIVPELESAGPAAGGFPSRAFEVRLRASTALRDVELGNGFAPRQTLRRGRPAAARQSCLTRAQTITACANSRTCRQFLRSGKQPPRARTGWWS